jgi:hypothetical protein
MFFSCCGGRGGEEERENYCYNPPHLFSAHNIGGRAGGVMLCNLPTRKNDEWCLLSLPDFGESLGSHSRLSSHPGEENE